MRPPHQAAPCFARRHLLVATGLAALSVCRGGPVLSETSPEHDNPIWQPDSPGDEACTSRAFEMRQTAIEFGDQAYGAVIVRDGVIIGQSWSKVILDREPTAHAEMAVIRDATRRIDNRNLAGVVMYSTSRPCPMCEAAAFWANVSQMVYGREMRRVGSPKLCR